MPWKTWLFIWPVPARAALGMAETLLSGGKGARRYVDLARRSAAFMERKSPAHGPGIARVIQAGIAVLSGDRPRAAALLEDAVKRFDAVSMLMLAHTASRGSGQLRGGTEGAALIAAAESFMREQGVADMERIWRR